MRRAVSKFGQPVFDPAADYAARRAFLFNGAAYAPGDEFDVRVNLKRAKQMYEARRLQMINRGPQAPSGRPPRRVAAPDRAANEPRVQTLALRARGSGWFDLVDSGGTVINDHALRKSAALEMVRGRIDG